MNRQDKITLFGFLFIQSIIYILLLLYSHQEIFSYLAYAGILFCFCASLLWKKPFPHRYLISIALFGTLLADLILLFFIEYRLLAMFFFSLVQLAYGAFLFLIKDRKSFFSLIVRILCILILEMIGLMILKDRFDLLVGVSLFYFSNLLCNGFLALFQKRWMLAAGFTLFLCCDMLIGISEMRMMNLLSAQSIWYQVFDLPVNIFWVFYLPSQVILAASVLFLKKKV